MGSVLGLVGPVSVYSDWVRCKVWICNLYLSVAARKNCPRRSVPEIHSHVAGTLSSQQTICKPCTSGASYLHSSCGMVWYRTLRGWFVCWLVACLTFQQHVSVSQGRICSDKLTCCHTEMEVGDPTFYLTQSQYTDTEPTSASADSITPGAWQGSHWSANV